jgi:hypothetical protein
MNDPLDGIEALRRIDELMRHSQEPRSDSASEEASEAEFRRDIDDAKKLVRDAIDHQREFFGGDTKTQLFFLELMLQQLEAAKYNRFGLSTLAHCFWFYLVNFTNNPATTETLRAGGGQGN